MGVDKTAVARETANKLTNLLIARRDVKAIQRLESDGGEWFASRKPMTLDDFERHLFGTSCMGTYLLDKKSRIKFVAFDIDLVGEGPYYVIRDLDPEKLDEIEAEYEALGELDPDARYGSWEQALHDPQHEGYRWVRARLRVVVESICQTVEKDLELPVIPVITGGGAHVLVPFGDRVHAADGRAAAHGVMESVYGFVRTSENFYSNAPEGAPKNIKTKRPDGETMTIEVFPKQDQLPEGNFGNLIRLPFGWHDKAKIRTYVMDRDMTKGPPWDLPKCNGVEVLDQTIQRLGLAVTTSD